MMRLKSNITELLKFWPVNFVLSIALALVAITGFFTNQYGIYALKRLVYVLPLAFLTFGFLCFWLNRVFFPFWTKINTSQKWQLILISLLLTLGVLWMRPLPMPDIKQEHSLVLSATGDKRDQSQGSLVEIRSIQFLNGQPLLNESLNKTSDWKWADGIFYSSGGTGSRLEINGRMPAGVLLDLRYFNQGGKLQITWDGVTQDLDLYRSESATAPLVFRGNNWFNLPILEFAEVLILSFLYLTGLLGALLLSLAAFQKISGKYFSTALFISLVFVVVL
ncbi:MAG: hypothetical protein LWX83_13430, partial [Anaerolineae bacterium]|nr:hypothetical protein [Anaerolineae bacterium]